MAVIKPAAIQIFEQCSPLINKCRQELIKQDWFGGSWWLNVAFGSSGFTFQLSKTTWFNHNGRGIHIEFWLEENEVETKSVPIVLHFEADTPARKQLSERFKKAFATFEPDFKDYRINHSAVCDKLQKQVVFSKSAFPKIIVAEFTRLQTIAPVIDNILD